MINLVREYTNFMFTQRGPAYDACLDALSRLGQSEIEASSNLAVAEVGPGFYSYAREIRRITKPSLLSKIFGADMNTHWLALENGKGVMRSTLRTLTEQAEIVREHISRIDLMISLAKKFEDELLHRWENNAGCSQAIYTIRERQLALNTHSVVLNQAILAINLLSEQARNLLGAAHMSLSTHKLAKKVNDRVREISENDALTLESRVTERRPGNTGLELYDRAGNCYYREDGWGKHHLISEAYTRSQLGQSVSSFPGLGESIPWSDRVEDS